MATTRIGRQGATKTFAPSRELQTAGFADLEGSREFKGGRLQPTPDVCPETGALWRAFLSPYLGFVKCNIARSLVDPGSPPSSRRTTLDGERHSRHRPNVQACCRVRCSMARKASPGRLSRLRVAQHASRPVTLTRTTTDAKVTWVLQQAGVEPRTFLSPDCTWGTVATAEEFATEEEAMFTRCPEGTTGIPMRMRYHPMRVGDATLPPIAN
jgi:hypothetical protein